MSFLPLLFCLWVDEKKLLQTGQKSFFCFVCFSNPTCHPRSSSQLVTCVPLDDLSSPAVKGMTRRMNELYTHFLSFPLVQVHAGAIVSSIHRVLLYSKLVTHILTSSLCAASLCITTSSWLAHHTLLYLIMKVRSGAWGTPIIWETSERYPDLESPGRDKKVYYFPFLLPNVAYV